VLAEYHRHPILGIYYYPHPVQQEDAQIATDLAEIARAGIPAVWLFFDPFYDGDFSDRLRLLLDGAQREGLEIVPVLGQFLQLNDHPEVKIVNADGTTSDDPRYWNMGCFRQPTLLEIARERALRFFRECGEHPALYRLEGKPVMSFVHEAYYRNSVPEFGGGPMKPNCYCSHCRDAFRAYLQARGLNTDVEPPRDNSDPILWQHWLNSHAEAIPQFLDRLIRDVKAEMPLWSTHECNDFYPASWQCVYTGNDFWRMGQVLDFGHEDMYPLEFDHRYQCYVYDYAKDIMRSAVGFDKLVTANGQAFNSWSGYPLPVNSMSEQIYSCLAHGALGMVWWGQWPKDSTRYDLLRQTKPYNEQYLALVEQLEGYILAPAPIALLYSWTTMGQALNDEHTYDTLLMYMLLVQSGFPVDILSEEQVLAGVLEQRGYSALCAMGCAALPDSVHQAVDRFARAGGLVIADYAPLLTDVFPPLFNDWRAPLHTKPRHYALDEQVYIPVQIQAQSIRPPVGAEILSRFDDQTPAICRVSHGKGTIILAGSYLGWDYSDYPGYYDLAAMFPFYTRRDEALRRWLVGILSQVGITPPVRSSHPDVEAAVWHSAEGGSAVLIVSNHLQETVQTVIEPPFGNPISLTLGPLEGRAIHLSS
jgi:hypothetical protein